MRDRLNGEDVCSIPRHLVVYIRYNPVFSVFLATPGTGVPISCRLLPLPALPASPTVWLPPPSNLSVAYLSKRENSRLFVAEGE